MDQRIKSLTDFRLYKQRMTAREMVKTNVGADYLDYLTDDDGQLKTKEDGDREFLVYPAGLAIEIIPDAKTTGSDGETYYLIIGNWEMTGSDETLPSMEAELYDYGLSETCFPEA